MDDATAAAAAVARSEDSSFDRAVRAVEAWARSNGSSTGMWVNRRRHSIGVGIATGNEVATTEALRALTPPGVKVRTRVASPRLASLWQLQADVEIYLEDEHIWEPWGAHVGVDERRHVLEVGLILGTPEHVRVELRSRFPPPDVEIVTARRARAM